MRDFHRILEEGIWYFHTVCISEQVVTYILIILQEMAAFNSELDVNHAMHEKLLSVTWI